MRLILAIFICLISACVQIAYISKDDLRTFKIQTHVLKVDSVSGVLLKVYYRDFP